MQCLRVHFHVKPNVSINHAHLLLPVLLLRTDGPAQHMHSMLWLFFHRLLWATLERECVATQAWKQAGGKLSEGPAAARHRPPEAIVELSSDSRIQKVEQQQYDEDAQH